MTHPPVSVVVPCKDVAPWAGECLESILAALPPDGEVIAVDDASSDGTPGILRSFAERDRRVRVLESPRRGVSAARNTGLDACSGEFVFFVDPDDAVEPDFFNALVSAAKAACADFVYCGYSDFVDGAAPVARALKGCYRFLDRRGILDGFVSRVIGYSFGDIRSWYAGRPLFSDREMASVCRGVYRRSLIGSLRFDESVELYEDAIFNAEYAIRCRSMASVDRPLYRVRNRQSGAMRTIGRDAARVSANKLKLLAARERIDASSGGSVRAMFAATCVLSLLEVASFAALGRIPRREAFAFVREYLSHECARAALAEFPLSFRKPVFSLCVLLLRIFAV